MSRAFVREPDGDSFNDELPEKPIGLAPNYVTARGLRLLKERLFALQRTRTPDLASEFDALAARQQEKAMQREIRYLEQRIASAILVDRTQQPTDCVRFGSTVDVIDESGAASRYLIVGEDEADVPNGLISWNSPLASALIEGHVGDVVVWHRPAGDTELEIVAISVGP